MIRPTRPSCTFADPGVARARRHADPDVIDDDDVRRSAPDPTWCAGTATIGASPRPADHGLDLPARVRVVLDHETAPVRSIAYATYGDDGEVAATADRDDRRRPVDLPDDYASQFRLWTDGDGIDGNVVLDYRFLDSETPSWSGGTRRRSTGRSASAGPRRHVEIDGRLAQYPSVEIDPGRAVAERHRSTVIFTKAQRVGRSANLVEPGERFDVAG